MAALTDSWVLACAALATVLITAVHYGVTLERFHQAERSQSKRKIPPLVPYLLPFLGNLPVGFVTNPVRFFSTSRWVARAGHPVRVKLFTKELFIVQGQENVLALLGSTSTSNTIFNASFLRQACAMSEKAVARFGSPDEEVPNYHARKNYLDATPLYTWSSAVIHGYLGGKSILQLSRRFEARLRTRIGGRAGSIDDELRLDDFIDLFAEDVVAALLDAMCGRGLLEQTPDFTKSFWKYCDSLPAYMKKTPRMFAPAAYKARDDSLKGVRKWQAWAYSQFDPQTTPLEDGDDEFWGSRFFRERYSTFVDEMGFDPRDMASNELGFLFGASANVTMSTYWSVIEVYKDAALLRDIRKEVESCRVDGEQLSFDVQRLVQQPLLQAVFSENLRLRCHNMYLRRTVEDVDIRDWFIPKGRLAIAWTTPGHSDPKVWSDPGDAHPVDTFWPGRFLKPAADGSVKFSLANTEGSWIPFGSGANLCPGNHFAKVHCILTVAVMVDTFDCDVLAPPKNLVLDANKFGMGVMGPQGKVPVRIRRRGA